MSLSWTLVSNLTECLYAVSIAIPVSGLLVIKQKLELLYWRAHTV